MACPEGFYGSDCNRTCRCQNNGKCRKNDGYCLCDPGWTGHTCEDICPEGFYGLHCMQSCECESPQFACHAAEGCVCRQGFFGQHCDEASSKLVNKQNETSSRAGIAWGIVVALLLCAAIIALIVYYRRRVANLKTEIAHVQYIADPTSQPDRHHFDNPVYAFQGPANDSTTLLNNIRNDLTSNNNIKPSNLDRYKLGFSDDDSNASSRG